MRKTLLVFALVLLATAATEEVLSKGFTGTRARGGGYFRASKTGYYSSRYYYSSSAMYWRSGYQYNYRGPSWRTHSGAALSPTANIMCKRLVIADNHTEGGHLDTYIVYNSTQWCYQEFNTDAGSKQNIDVDNIMLSRYRFNLSILPYPQVHLLVYPDKDITVPSVNTSLRLTKIGFSKDRANPADLVGEIDLSTLDWEPCTLDSCQSNLTGPHMGNPSSRFVEMSRVFFSSVRAVWNKGVVIELRWWLATDFSEDANYEHIFLFPGAIKFDLLMRPLSANVTDSDNKIVTPAEMVQRAMVNNYSGPVYANVEALFAGPASGVGSSLQYLPTAPGLEAIEYNPQSMERLVYGTAVDMANGRAAYLSFPNADNRQQLCYSTDPIDDDSTCMYLQNKAQVNQTTFCTWAEGDSAATLPELCKNNFMQEGMRAVKLQWIDQGAFANPKKPSVNFYWNVGFHDPSVKVLSAGMIAKSCIAVVMCLVMAMF